MKQQKQCIYKQHDDLEEHNILTLNDKKILLRNKIHLPTVRSSNKSLHDKEDGNWQSLTFNVFMAHFAPVSKFIVVYQESVWFSMTNLISAIVCESC